MKLYDTNGTTVLQAINVDSDMDNSAVSSRNRTIYFDESSLSTLNAGSSYRLSLLPGTTALVLAGMTMDTSPDLEAWWAGAIAKGSTRTDAGAWTDDALTRYGINPIISDITAPAGGGGGGAPIVGSSIVRGAHVFNL